MCSCLSIIADARKGKWRAAACSLSSGTSCCCGRHLLENTAGLHIAAATDTETTPWGREMSPGTFCWPVLRIYLLSALPHSSLSDRHSAGTSLAFSHQFRCADSHSPFHSHQHPAATLFTSAASTEFFTPPCPVKGGKHYRRSHITFMTFTQRKMHKNSCLPQLFSFTILISWNKSTKNLQVYCFLHEDWTVNICIYFAVKPVLSVTECDY